jgi:hypothetical protein
LQKGVMSTRDLKIRGSSAEIDMRGDINIEKETHNLHVKVIPSMRRGVTALVTMVNPIFGVGVAVAQSLLKDPVGQILAYEYSVTGPWARSESRAAERADAPGERGAMSATRVAAIQMVSTPDVQANFASAARLVAQAAEGGAKIAALPNSSACSAAATPTS